MHEKAEGLCFHCGKYNGVYESDLAHKIPTWERNIKKYGYKVIYDEDNMDLTCKGACNDLSNLNPASNPIAVKKLAAKIKRKLCIK